jgi:transcriptional activator SPT8
MDEKQATSPIEVKPSIQQEAADEPAGHHQDADAKSDGSYDPLFDEPDADAPPPPSTNTQKTREPSPTPTERADLSLPGTVPSSQFAPRAASTAVAKNAPPVLDPTTYASYSADVLMTASVDGQVVLWDLRAHTPGKGAGRLHMTDKTPPWCASVRATTR